MADVPERIVPKRHRDLEGRGHRILGLANVYGHDRNLETSGQISFVEKSGS